MRWLGWSFQRRQWQTTPVLLPGRSHGWRSLVQAAIHGVTKNWTQLSEFTFTFHFQAMGEGNGNPLQCSCLENPRDGGTWWAAVYGVTQSQTRLKWRSSSMCYFCNNNFMLLNYLFGHTVLLPWPGIEPIPLAVKAQHPNHWTIREFPITFIENS